MMTADQYREAIAALGLSLGSAARVFGINERTSRRFATGNDIPWYLEMLINIMVAKGVAPDEIKDPRRERLHGRTRVAACARNDCDKPRHLGHER